MALRRFGSDGAQQSFDCNFKLHVPLNCLYRVHVIGKGTIQSEGAPELPKTHMPL